MIQLTVYQWSYEISACFSSLAILGILGLYIYHLRAQAKEIRYYEGNTGTSTTTRAALVRHEYMNFREKCCYYIPWLPLCTIICMMCYFIVNLLASVEIVLGDRFCFERVQLFVFFYGISRWMTGAVYVLRLELVFKDSSYGYSPRFLISLQLIQFLCVLACLSISPFWVYDTSTDLSQCTFQAPNWFMIFFVMVALVTNFGSLGLFLKPLFKVLATSLDDRLRFVAIKYTVLTMAATVASLFSVLGAGLQIFHITRLCDVAECLCLLLMSNTYKSWYEWMCAGCIVCCKSPIYVVEKNMAMEQAVVNRVTVERHSSSDNNSNNSNTALSPSPTPAAP